MLEEFYYVVPRGGAGLALDSLNRLLVCVLRPAAGQDLLLHPGGGDKEPRLNV